MKQWRCTVCGYIHEGEAPPEKCPVCGADRSKFVPVAVSAEIPAEAVRADGGIKKWRCTVCGYIHEGEAPPEKCPVCGADRSKFVPVAVSAEGPETDPVPIAETAGPEGPAPDSGARHEKIFALMVKHHAHPISVHIPNGLLPVSVVFLFLSAAFNWAGMGQAAFFNMVFVVLALPFVLFSGYIEWQKKYGGALTPVFKAKICLAGAVAATSILLVAWMAVDPRVTLAGSPGRGLFLFINLVMLAAAGGAGLIGGRLVFKD